MKRIGDEGEEIAAKYLLKKGLKIIDKKYRGNGGEIDIIARQDDLLIFVEVKTWRRYGYEELEWAIDKRKQRRLYRCANYFIAMNPRYAGMHLRFDVIYIRYADAKIHHIPNAFGVDG